MKYTEEQIKNAYQKITELLHIVRELEDEFQGRHFTLDGHLVGSIGEIMAAYYYGIELYDASCPVHDGKTDDGKKVQIKITQTDRIVINEEPDYLIVLFLNKQTGKITEIYNGTGITPWKTAYTYKKHNTKYMMVSKLIEMDKTVINKNRIKMIHPIEKYSKQQNVHIAHKKTTGKTLLEGFINKNNQKNCGCTGQKGTHEGQVLYNMKCLNCGFEYKANGCDVWLRKCPNCI